MIFSKTGIDPRNKSEGKLFRDHALNNTLKRLRFIMATDRYNAAEAEARWQKTWEERGIFATKGYARVRFTARGARSVEN